uniref:Uncharacterized protein n=1 Tax=Meleagris gallopavo TaxID=9103 RepID=A0A803YLT9_MELGA
VLTEFRGEECDFLLVYLNSSHCWYHSCPSASAIGSHMFYLWTGNLLCIQLDSFVVIFFSLTHGKITLFLWLSYCSFPICDIIYFQIFTSTFLGLHICLALQFLLCLLLFRSYPSLHM